MKIYIASSILAFDRAKVFAAEISERGHTVVSTWHASESLGPTDDALSEAQREQIARIDIDEVLSADAVLFLAHKYGRGSLVESGIAIGARIPVVALGNKLEFTLMLGDSRYVNWFVFKEDAFLALDLIQQECDARVSSR